MPTYRQWKKFCGVAGYKNLYDLSKPFVIDGWKYATDGRVCIREPTNAKNTTKGRTLPRIDDIFAGKFRRRREFSRLLTAPKKDIKPTCSDWPTATLDGEVFNGRYLAMIHALRKVKYKPGHEPEKAMAFRTGDVEILLMAIDGYGPDDCPAW